MPKPPRASDDTEDWLEGFKRECQRRGLSYEEARQKAIKALDKIPNSSKYAFSPSEALDLLKPH